MPHRPALLQRSALAVLFLLAAAVVGCEKARPPTQAELVGKWTGNVSTVDVVLVLHGDGTFDKDDSGGLNPFYKNSGLADVTDWGRWRLAADGELVFGDAKGITTSSVFAVLKGKDTLEIRSGADATAYKLARASGPMPAPGPRYVPGEPMGD